MKLFEGKCIILGAPKHFGLADLIERELTNLGFTVINISFLDNQFRYKSLVQRIQSFIAKNLGGDKFYKTKLQFQRHADELTRKLDKIERADYAFIIRPDVYPRSFLEEVIQKSDKSVGYQWDGLDRFPNIYDRIPLFSRFYIFDSGDHKKHPDVRPTTNFYPHTIKPNPLLPKTDFYYSGSFNKSRIDALESIARAIRTLKLDFFYILLYKKKIKRAKTFLHACNEGIDFVQNIQYVMQTRVLIDIVNPVHSGLSFRVFEAIGFKKKLITNNPSVVNHDFYHPNNILIWHKHSTADDLRHFLTLPYQPLPQEVYEKYGFSNWIKRMLLT